MGRRSINTTKSGKYMNPTDQARKEARKKELKKNKKQRQLVRAAVLKGKDPSQIIEEMEKIDEMEYNVMQPPPLNEKVLKDKRKKLKETLDRVLKMYAKDEQEKYVELKDQMIKYERRRLELVSYFEAVRHAQQVQVDEIPLPATGNDMGRGFSGALTAQIPLPDMPQPPIHAYPTHPHYLPQHHPLVNIPVPPSILKKTSIYTQMSTVSIMPTDRDPPGVPPYPPPDLSDDEDDDRGKSSHKSKTIRFADEKMISDDRRVDDDDRDGERDKDKDSSKVKPTSLQQKMLAMAGQDIDSFMKEMEEVHKKKETERAQDLNARLSSLEDDNLHNEQQQHHPQLPQPQPPPQPAPPMPLMGLPPPPPLMYRPPPPPLHLRIPPPPPPRMGIRLPPGPPPGMPRMLRPGGPMPMVRLGAQMPGMPPAPPMPASMANMANAQKTPNVLSAAPQLITRKEKDSGKSSTTIEAKPQIRNLAADVTRFLPTSLRVKRTDDKKKPSAPPIVPVQVRVPERMTIEQKPAAQPPVKTKDDAYLQFMQEMQGLL